MRNGLIDFPILLPALHSPASEASWARPWRTCSAPSTSTNRSWPSFSRGPSARPPPPLLPPPPPSPSLSPPPLPPPRSRPPPAAGKGQTHRSPRGTLLLREARYGNHQKYITRTVEWETYFSRISLSLQRSASVEAVATVGEGGPEDNNNKDSDGKSSGGVPSVADFKLGAPGGVGPLGLPPSSFFPPPPPLGPGGALTEEAAKQLASGGGAPQSASPLQGMASITNSLTNQPLPTPYRPAQRSFKAILPPITQEQFDRYSDINTEELVRTVRIIKRYQICGEKLSKIHIWC